MFSPHLPALPLGDGDCRQIRMLTLTLSSKVCSHASLDAGPTEPENAREDWQDWRGCQPTQESGYGSLGYRDSETDCCDSLEEATQVSPALVNQLSQTVSWTEL